MSVLVPLPTRRSTLHLAQRLAPLLCEGDLVILTGGLGMGKTFFTRGLARALGLPSDERVTSPTFALVRELETRPPVIHCDLYRLSNGEDTEDLGLRTAREGGVLLVEWGAPFAQDLGGDALEITLRGPPREAEIQASGPRSQELLTQLKQTLPLQQRSGTAHSTP